MIFSDINATVLTAFRGSAVNNIYYKHHRTFCAMDFRRSGGSCVLYNGKRVTLPPNSIAFIPSDTTFELISKNENMPVFVFHFTMPKPLFDEVMVFKVKNPEIYESLFLQAAETWWEKKTPGYRCRVTSIFYEILWHLSNDVNDSTPRKNDHIVEAAEFMKHNFFNASISIQKLAMSSLMSESLFRRKFQQIFGISPKKYLDDLRIEHAQNMLETGNFSQTEIARSCGYYDVKYFRTAFKNKTGMSISAYMKKNNCPKASKRRKDQAKNKKQSKRENKTNK